MVSLMPFSSVNEAGADLVFACRLEYGLVKYSFHEVGHGDLLHLEGLPRKILHVNEELAFGLVESTFNSGLSSDEKTVQSAVVVLLDKGVIVELLAPVGHITAHQVLEYLDVIVEPCRKAA